MKLSDFSYSLSKAFIAQSPISEREKCKMLFFDRESNKIEHLIFSDIVKLLSSKDILVLNKTRVFPARLIAENIEILLVKKIEKDVWEVLAKPRKKIKEGLKLSFGSLSGEIVSSSPCMIKFSYNGNFFDILEEIGNSPLPPYIKKMPDKEDKIYYQTVYAKEIGSIAAPTAGLHFTDEILLRLEKNGVSIFYITLHIGIGTFKMPRCEDIKSHQMEGEYVKINDKIPLNKRLVACGTSVVRALESLENLEPKEFQTDIFIYPGFKFKWVKGLLTNFHLPKSPPFIMVSAYVGLDKLKELYEEAKSKNYRFGSYGDCMLIL